MSANEYLVKTCCLFGCLRLIICLRIYHTQGKGGHEGQGRQLKAKTGIK